MTKNAEHFFMYLFAICTSSFEKFLFTFYLINWIVLLVFNFWISLYIQYEVTIFVSSD
jgi:hypothetical protein